MELHYIARNELPKYWENKQINKESLTSKCKRR